MTNPRSIADRYEHATGAPWEPSGIDHLKEAVICFHNTPKYLQAADAHYELARLLSESGLADLHDDAKKTSVACKAFIARRNATLDQAVRNVMGQNQDLLGVLGTGGCRSKCMVCFEYYQDIRAEFTRLMQERE